MLKGRIYSPRHCRCRDRGCGRRFKGIPDVSHCPACNRVGRLDKWAASRPWRASTCHCDAYHYPHRMRGGKCLGPRLLPELPGLAGLPF